MKVGDVVRLKHGGPKMTVTEIREYSKQSLETVWFEEGSIRQYGYFDPKAVRIVRKRRAKGSRK